MLNCVLSLIEDSIILYYHGENSASDVHVGYISVDNQRGTVLIYPCTKTKFAKGCTLEGISSKDSPNSDVVLGSREV